MGEAVGRDRQAELQERSPGELVSELAEQISRLVRDEIRLAQLELQQKGKRAGIGVGLFGGSGFVALYGLGAIVAGLVLLLAMAVEPWAAAMIVGIALLLVAGALALMGKNQVRQAKPPIPKRAVESIKQDIDVIKEGARR
jgi:uncharacterized membrane protein YqjE